MWRTLGFAALATLSATAIPLAQTPPAPRTVDVEGRPMRVWTAGLEERQGGRPVLVLEAGAGEGLDNWKPVFAQLARVAPVVAYDRRGIGGSAPDSEKLTLRRVAQSLHALLQRSNVPPPYVLVAHSWGGLVARAYIDQYASEVVGLVLVDALNPGLTRVERAKAAPPGERDEVLAPPTLPQIPADTPPGLRAEYELVGSEMVNDYPQARALRAPAGIPIAAVMATPPNRLKNMTASGIGLQAHDTAGLALTSPKGLFVAASHVGHMVHRDDPDLVVRLVEHVLRNAAQAPAK